MYKCMCVRVCVRVNAYQHARMYTHRHIVARTRTRIQAYTHSLSLSHLLTNHCN